MNIKRILICISVLSSATLWMEFLPRGLQPTRATRNQKLLLFVAVDQGRYDYFVRFRPVFRGGINYLLDNGVFFTDAHQNHAITVTSPGHATLSTGLHPRNSGIIDHEWYDREKKKIIYSVEDPTYPLIGSSVASSGRSPRNLFATTLSDWIKRQNPRAKVFSVSAKDRSAILMGGKNADAALWFDSNTGQFVTSYYYWRRYPRWLDRFHSQKISDSYFGKAWEPLPVDASRFAGLGIEELDRGVCERNFPHLIGAWSFFPNPAFYAALYSSPFIDAYLVKFAEVLIENESIGKDDDLDFLGLSFSAVDLVGHAYGPNSHETFDAMLRLDLALGELFGFLDKTIGLENVVICLSADHGAMELPEYLGKKNKLGWRASVQDVLCFQTIGKKLEMKFGKERWLLEGLYLDHGALERHHIPRPVMETELAQLIKECPPVANVWTRTQLESPRTNPDPYLQLFRNSFHPKRSPDLFVQFKEFYLSSTGTGTDHGSSYRYDTHVPVIILVPGVSAKEVAERINTVDVAPTLAALLKVPTPSKLDGLDRSSRIVP